MSERRYVSTNRDLASRSATGEVRFDTPAAGGAQHGDGPVALRSAEGLLDALGERVFVAEPASEAAGGGAVVEVARARLVAETAWDDEAAARFAAACAEHALGGDGEVALPHGRTLGEVLADVHRALERPGPAEGLLGTLSRFSTLRRLRRDGAAVSDLATLAAKQDARVGLELLEDPAWTTLAAIAEAVLASAEALRYRSHPRFVASQETLAERRPAAAVLGEPDIEETPWGPVLLGPERVPAYVSAAACAEEAAERARQAVADSGGEAAASEERAFQAQLLARLLEERAEEGAAGPS